jgi:protein involved in polysaccharide export with SLBB domain
MTALKEGFATRRRWLPRIGRTVWGLLLAAGTAHTGLAQQTGDASGRQPMATRTELEAAAAEAERVADSPGYSDGFRKAKRAELALIRERLTEGDFQVGDAINLVITGDTAYTGGPVQVSPGRVLSLRGLPDIPLRGVLRSELESYLTEQVGKYVRDPELKARPLIRLSVLGGVGKPGFYQLDADMLLSDALTTAGGIGNATNLKSSKILRDNEKIVDHTEFEKAISEGRSLDQLNLRAGDVIDVGVQKQHNVLETVRTIAIIPGLILSVYGIGKLVGAF